MRGLEYEWLVVSAAYLVVLVEEGVKAYNRKSKWEGNILPLY